jgi:hypothetical protein
MIFGSSSGRVHLPSNRCKKNFSFLLKLFHLIPIAFGTFLPEQSHFQLILEIWKYRKILRVGDMDIKAKRKLWLINLLRSRREVQKFRFISSLDLYTAPRIS